MMVDYEHQGKPELGRRFLSRVIDQDINWDDPHFAETPTRFGNMLTELTTQEEFKFTTFPSKADDMVVIKNIPFSSLCAHHVIPYVGYAHIGYVPGQEVAGLSKFGRMVKYYSRSLSVQEELTQTIGQALNHLLTPQGIIVVMEAEHLCMTIRGAQMPGTKTSTSFVAGVFADHERTAKMEFFELIRDRSH
jgi:GTP cyclohydrolase I